MSTTVKQNFRLKNETMAILEAAIEATGSNKSRIADMAIALYGMEIVDADGLAKEFFINMMMSRVAAHKMHARRLPEPVRKNRTNVNRL